jgi:small subunit ribosomal protein S8
VDDLPVIREIKRISKPGLRLYTKGKDCKPVLNGQGISILSTSKGIMSDRQCRNDNIGGEVLCTVC